GGNAYTVASLELAINNGGYGITASEGANLGSLTFTSSDSSVSITGAGVSSTTVNATTAFVASPGYYTVGITNSGLGAPDAAPDVADQATNQTAAAPAVFAGTSGGSGGVATMSYTDGA